MNAMSPNFSALNLPHTERLPVLFLGHGSPMNVITDNPWRQAWRALGERFGPGGSWPRPALILCVSAHWITRGTWLTGMAQPRTIHDFGGFPQELFEQQYPAPGAPEVALGVAEALRTSGTNVGVDGSGWGLDHGTWGVLKPMFPDADIPVVQLSLDVPHTPEQRLALGERLQGLRERGVLIVASGNTVHNLRVIRFDAPDNQAYDWAVRFDERIAHALQTNRHSLAQFATWPDAAQAHPTPDHLWPLLVAAGAARGDDAVTYLCPGYQAASIAMRCVVWGDEGAPPAVAT